MAYDEHLANRLRDALEDQPNITEQKMFGGVAFMAAGNLAVGASSQGGLIVRADPDTCEALLEPGVQLMEMRSRPMRGWLHVNIEYVDSDADLHEWIRRGLAYAQSLRAK